MNLHFSSVGTSGYQTPLLRIVMCERKQDTKNFERHVKSKTHLTTTDEKLKCQLCEFVYHPIDKVAQLQSLECFISSVKSIVLT